MNVYAKVLVLFSCLCALFLLSACSQNESPLPTRVPTAMPLPLPATNTPPAVEIESDVPDPTTIPDAAASAPAEIEAVLQAIDLETCQEIIETQAELNALQEEGNDVTELATAVAELALELEGCELFVTATPEN